MKPTFETFIFDLDGTILDTLPDLVQLTNRALTDVGFPTRTEAEILSFVGNGIRSLMNQAIPEGFDSARADEATQRWRDLYPEYGTILTVPYDGIPEVLSQLKAQGKKLAVLSNKFDGGVQSLIPEYFPGIFDAAHGECAEFVRKPDPCGLIKTIEEVGGEIESTVYVGDSGGDMLTAHNAGVFALGVTWGYRSEEDLRAHGADAIITEPAAILDFV
ncbi:MAG: HAD family hydrolase [Raoultibacter sp.]